ncbi:MAG: DNA primase [Bacteroidales bacterium]|nr:MAG: DNA primase [Bacteroidales bacterium]
MIDHNTISRIFDTVEITEVIQDFVTLRKRGANFMGLCPFHNEKTPSFSVSPSKGIYKCFGCGRGGNAVNFIMEHEHLSYPEALKFLAGKYNIEVVEKELTAEEIQQQNERESMQVVTSFAQKYFTEALFNSVEGMAVGLSYFKERGFRQEIIKKFQLGYCPEQKDAFTKSAQSAGYKLDYLVKSGLSIRRESHTFDRFSGRIIFPIHTLSGTVAGFGGRTLKSDQKVAKYVNSPESDIYNKSKTLYGIYFAKKMIAAEDKCFLVEGYTDVLAMFQMGIENVVASSGTSLTPEQIRLIKRFTPNITILYDGDEAGIKASLRGIDLILEEGLNVKVLMLPEGEDPDSYSKKVSPTQMNDFIVLNEQDFIRFKTRLLIDDTQSDPVKRANMIREIARTISVIPDSITRSVYIRECSNWLQVEEGVLYMEINRARRKKAEQNYLRLRKVEDQVIQRISKKQPETYSGNTETQEREIIRLLLNYGNHKFRIKNIERKSGEKNITVAEFIVNEITNDELKLDNPVFKQIFEEYQHHLNEQKPLDQKYFINHPDQSIRDKSAELLSISYDLSKIWRKHENYIPTEEMNLQEILPETLIAFKNERIKIAILDIQNRIKQAQETNNLEQVEELQERFIILTNLKKQLSKDLGDRIIL